jgi:hypothetical protein
MLWLALMAALTVANGEELAPERVSPSQSASELEEPPLPTLEVGSSNPEQGVLPKSGELPARPRAVAPSNLSLARASRGQAPSKRERFEVIRSLAMSDRRAVYLLERAKISSNPASRRVYLRAYYRTLASRMRWLEPKLISSIDAYEEGKLHELSGVRTSSVRGRRSRIRRSVRLAAHHRGHRFSKEMGHGVSIAIPSREGASRRLEEE